MLRFGGHHLQPLDLSIPEALCHSSTDGEPSKLRAITAAKRKNDCLDARTLAVLLRCNLFPACYVSPAEYQTLRCYLRERALLVRIRVMFKNKTAGMLIERGVPYETRKLHRKRILPRCWKTTTG